MMKRLLVGLAIAGMTASTVAAAVPIKVFLFTNEAPSGSTDEQLKARQESLHDLMKALADEKYRGIFTLVQSRTAADLAVELVSRGATSTGANRSATQSTGGGTASSSTSASVTRQHLRFRLSSAQITDELTTEAQLSWPKMAERAAEDIARWVAAHDQQITKSPR